MTKKAIISGICGMDASHLSDLLLGEGYKVVGFYRRSSSDKFDRIHHLLRDPNFSIEEGDITDSHYISELIKREQADVFFNAAAQSHVGTSFKQPHLTFEVNTKGVLNILEAIRQYSPATKMIQFSTSEMWGNNIDDDNMQRETTPFAPRSPYAVSKLAAFELCRTYRESYDVFACSSICHNHTGPRRGDNFVEKKIVNWVSQNHHILSEGYEKIHQTMHISSESKKKRYFFHTCNNGLRSRKSYEMLSLGNISPFRDFSHSKDCVRAIYMMSQMKQPKDYVVSSGVATSVEQLLETIFGFFNKDYRDFVYIDKDLYRPAEVDYLCGDCSLIRRELGWKPEYNLDKILKEMLDEQIEKAATKVHSYS